MFAQVYMLKRHLSTYSTAGFGVLGFCTYTSLTMYSFKDFNVKVQEGVLKNGIPVLLFKREGMPINAEISFASGSIFDPDNLHGLAHFAEHLLLSGSERFPIESDLAEFMESKGSAYNAATAPEYITVYVEVAGKEDFMDAVVLFDEALSKPLFAEEAVENERRTIIQEIHRKHSSPVAYSHELRRKLFFQGTRVGRSNLGTIDSVSQITREDLLAYKENMIVSGRATIVISGDIDIEYAIQVLDDGLHLERTERYVLSGEEPVLRKESIAVAHYPEAKHAQISFGFRTCPRQSEDVIPLRILAAISGGARASVLSKRLRHETGLVYSVGANTMNMFSGGTWAVKTATSKENLQEVLDLITEEFTRIHSGGVTNEELQFAVKKSTKSIQRSMQTSDDWVAVHFYDHMIGFDHKLPDTLNAYNKLTLDDLHRVGEKYFKKDAWYLAICGDIEEKDFSVNI